MRPLHIHYLGRVPYQVAWDLQKSLVEKRKADAIPDTLLLLEHDPVITLGRSGKRTALLHDEAGLARHGVQLIQSDRGGDATYHGPGQIVGYPIMDLAPDWKDIRRFVQGLEDAQIKTCADYGLSAGRLEGMPGVWFQNPDRKIGAIGARFTRWISHHGFAFNVNTQLAHFDLIVPCGLTGKTATSLEAELGHKVPLAEVMERLALHLATHFGRAPVVAHGL